MLKSRPTRFCSRACFGKSEVAAENGRKIPRMAAGDPRWSRVGNRGRTKGRIATPEQLGGLRAGWEKQKTDPHIPDDAAREKMRAAKLGKKLRPEHAAKLAAALRNLTPEQYAERARKGGLARRGSIAPWFRGPNNPNWRGGVHAQNATERKVFQTSAEYVSWRRSVFERDNFTCQHCGVRGGELHADHIKPFATHPQLRTDLSNGRTLCVSCHRKTDTWGAKSRLKSGG